ALREIVLRHETCRTTFRNREARPVAVTESQPLLTLTAMDLSAMPPAERDANAQQLMAEEARHLFDLTHGPLLRAKLLRLARNEHVLLLVTHHIACDGWSMGVFYQELAALYEAFAHGRPSPPNGLQIGYADFAHWQRQRLQGPVLEEQLAYWKQQLEGAPAALDLPAGRPRPPLHTYRGATKC